MAGGKKAREKGARGEREVVEMLRPIYPKARRRCSGEESQDAVRGRDIEGTPGLCVQVQLTGGTLTPWKKLTEAMAAAHPNEIPVAIVKRTRKGTKHPDNWVACIRVGDLLALMLQAGAIE